MTVESNLFANMSEHLFKTVHNHTEINRKSNVQLTILNNGKPVLNLLYNNVIAAQAPLTNVYFYMYIAANFQISDVFGEEKDNDGWVDAVSMVNDNRIFGECFTVNHLAIPKSATYFKRLKDGRTIVAIRKDVVDGILKDGSSHIYMTAGYDPDNVGVRTVYASSPADSSSYGFIQNYCLNNTTGVLTINGYVYPFAAFNNITDRDRDWIELVTDEDVIVEFVVDADSYVRRAYTSSEYSYDPARIPSYIDMENPPTPYDKAPEPLIKDLIQIPKALIGDRVITHDTITVIVRDKDTGRGVYLPFTGEHSIAQVTRNVIGLTSYIVDSAIDFLDADDIEFVLFAANHTKENYIEQNGEFTAVLNMLPDDEVLDILRGNTHPPVESWKAENLEQSDYMKTTMSMVNLVEHTNDGKAQQINTLGLHGYCNHIVPFIFDGGYYDGNLSFDLPLIYDTYEVKPFIFVDGLKIHDTEYSWSVSGRTVVINMDTSELTSVSKIDYRVARKYDLNKEIVHVKDRNEIVFDNSRSMEYYQIEKSAEHPFFEDNTVYRPVGLASIGTEVVDGNHRTVILSPALYEESYLLINRDYFAESYFEVDTNNLDSFTFIPKMSIGDETVPLVKEGNFLVFLNGYSLTECIDYNKTLIFDEEDRIHGYQITIQSRNYMKIGNNRVEIYRVDEIEMGRNPSFVGDPNISINSTNNIFLDKITAVVIGGKWRSYNYLEQGFSGFAVPDESVYGMTYEIRTLVDRRTYKQAIPLIDYDADLVKQGEIAKFRASRYDYTDMTEFEFTQPTYLVSTYLVNIVNDILSGKLKVEFFNSDNDILAQVSHYAWLKEFDIFFNPNCLRSVFTINVPHYLEDMSPKDDNDRRYIYRLIEIIDKLWEKPDVGIQGQIFVNQVHTLIITSFFQQHDAVMGDVDFDCPLEVIPDPRPDLQVILHEVIKIAFIQNHDISVGGTTFSCAHTAHGETNSALEILMNSVCTIALRATRTDRIVKNSDAGRSIFVCDHTREPSNPTLMASVMSTFSIIMLIAKRELATISVAEPDIH